MKTAEDIISAFEGAAAQLLRFRRAQLGKGEPLEGLIVEAQIRLQQTQYFLRRFQELESEFASDGFTHATAGGGLATQLNDVGDVLKTYGEAFYYFAFRATQALGSIQGFDLKFDPVGVRNVRNLMLQHPLSKDGVMVSWWEFGCPEGLILAPGSAVGQAKWDDKGLYPNAQEFIEKLSARLSNAT